MPSKTAGSERMMFQLNLRQRGISDQAVLRAMDSVPRNEFVLAETADQAWRDTALPIACGQTISQPFVVAYMTQQLQVAAHHRVLEIGTGSGYQAAILSKLAGEVVSIERFRLLADSARKRLAALGCDNVTVQTGDGLNVPRDLGAFDRIIVTAAMENVPETLLDALAPDGILIAPVGPAFAVQKLVRIDRTGEGDELRDMLDVRFVPALPGIAREL